jgi:hypothetical protein
MAGGHAEPPIDLSRKLARRIRLSGGPRSHLGTLMEAAILIRELEPFRQPGPYAIVPGSVY